MSHTYEYNTTLRHHRTFEPPRPVLRLIEPRFDGPSPRSSELNAGRRPKLLPVPNGADGDARKRRSCSQSYAAG